MSINKAIISGNLTRDPELRSTSGGLPILGFCVAVNDRHKNQQTGEWEDTPNFIDCTMFGTRAESISRYLTKGTKVTVEGKLRWSQWGPEGQKRSKIEIIVDEIEFMSRRDSGSGYAGSSYAAPAYGAAAYGAPAYGAAPMAHAAPAPMGAYAEQQVMPAVQPQVAPQQVMPAQPAPAPQPVSVMPAVDTASSIYDDDIPF